MLPVEVSFLPPSQKLKVLFSPFQGNNFPSAHSFTQCNMHILHVPVWHYLLYLRGLFQAPDLQSGISRSEIAEWTVLLKDTPPSLLPQPMGLAVSCFPVLGSFCPSSLQFPRDRRECSCWKMHPHPALGTGQARREEEPTLTNVFCPE